MSKETEVQKTGLDAAIDEREAVLDKEASKYLKEDLLAIFDSLVFEEGYEEDIKLGGKLTFTLSTLTGDDEVALSSDGVLPVDRLARSISKFKGQDLKGMSGEDRVKIIKKQPAVILSSMLNKLSEFENKVFFAEREGSKNF